MSDGRTTRHAHRRPELVRAAAAWIEENGLTDLSLRPLADGIGVSHATLLHHFGSKEALLIEVLDEFRGRQRLLLAGIAAENGDAGAGDLIWVAWRALTAPRAEPFVRLIFELAARGLREPDRYGAFLRAIVAEWTESAQLLLDRQGLSANQAAPLATFIYDSLRGLLLDLVTTRQRKRVESGVATLVSAVDALVAEQMEARR